MKNPRKPGPTETKVVPLPVTDRPAWPDALNKVRLLVSTAEMLKNLIVQSVCEPRAQALKDAEHAIFLKLRAAAIGDEALWGKCPDTWFSTTNRYSSRDHTFRAKHDYTVPMCFNYRNFNISAALHAEMREHTEACETFESDRQQLRARIYAGLKSSRTVGAFLSAYPAFVEHIPAETLNRLVENAPTPNLPAVANAEIVSIIQKLRAA